MELTYELVTVATGLPSGLPPTVGVVVEGVRVVIATSVASTATTAMIGAKTLMALCRPQAVAASPAKVEISPCATYQAR
jgi:hypothetical protein